MGNNLVEVNEKYNGSVTELVIGPAPANIVSEAVMGELGVQLDKAAKDINKKLIIITGAGDHFSFGASVAEHTPDKCDSMITKFHLFIEKVLSCPVPILGRVRGNCLGGGFELVLACHFIFAEKTASFAVPEIKLGVFPPPASLLLPLIVGDKIACQIVLTGANKTADELKNYNLINECSENVEVLDKAIDAFITKRIVPLSASTIRVANRAVRLGVLKHYKENVKEVEKLYLKTLMGTHDAVEGIASFMEKRPPKWQNN
jgi:cyclohexa-1,5-dienecarbonyl-CoA hydratase